MNVSLTALDKKHRALTIAAWALMIASPFLLLMAVSLVIGQNAFQSSPVWTDELDYWRSVFSWLHVGGNAGFSGIGELTAMVGTLGVHGLSPVLMYVWFGALFGWGFSGIVLANCLWVAAGALVFCLLNRPKAGVAALLSITLMVYMPVVLYCATSMTELANYGLLLFYLAFLMRLWSARKDARGIFADELPITKGLPSLILCTLTVMLCCMYRITFIGLFVPLIIVACDVRWSGKLFLGAMMVLFLSVSVYYFTSLYASPFSSGFLYNFLRTESLELGFRMFLSHAKANLIDYFVRSTSNAMESLQRLLYCGVAVLALIGSFVRVQKANGRFRVRFGLDLFSLFSFLMLFVPFAIVVCAYETNDWSDYRTLAPFLWLVIAAYLIRGRKFVPLAYLAGCAAILVMLLTGEPVGAYADVNRFTAVPFTVETQELCAAIPYDAAATPFTNTVRTDVFTLEMVSSLQPGIGIQTGWFTEDTVGKSGWILTDHLKIALEGYELVYKNKAGSVYRLTTRTQQQ